MSEKSENWLVSLDSDNISLFIKTWFAYLASIHDLVINQMSDTTILDNLRGDKFFLDKYRNDILGNISINDVLKENIIATYINSKETILVNYPEYYFQTFYKKIPEISLFSEEAVLISRDEYKFNISVAPKGFFISILIISEPIRIRVNSVFMQKKFPITPDESKLTMIDNGSLFYDYIRDNIRLLLYNNIKHAPNTIAYNEVKGKFDFLLQLIMSKIIINDVRNLIYKPWYEQGNIVEDDLKDWFHGFCYNLRNVLFHRIIDPFDINWSKTMRTSYQGLRELLMLNIEEIENQNVPAE